MNGQTVVVTGANRGLGLEFVKQLKPLGAQVIATARDPKAAIDLRALEVRIEPLDVSSMESIQGLADSLREQPIDLLINNAGMGGAGNGIASLEPAELEAFFAVNTLGPVFVAQALLPNLRLGGHRCVAQVSSRMGSLADNAEGGYYGYRASKAALNMLHRCLALELAGQGFVCVTLHPGWVRTSMGGHHAPLSPQESVRGLLGVLGRLRREDNGRFLDYTGADVPW